MQHGSEIDELKIRLTELSPAQVGRMVEQLRSLLDILPPDESSDGDRRLRNDLEAFLTGYSVGIRR